MQLPRTNKPTEEFCYETGCGIEEDTCDDTKGAMARLFAAVAVQSPLSEAFVYAPFVCPASTNIPEMGANLGLDVAVVSD